MRSGANGNNVFDTINAAASAIASSDDRLHQSSPIHVSLLSPFQLAKSETFMYDYSLKH
jgi:hypothetical protein